MSASSKKKLRKEQNAAVMTEKQQKELKEAKKLKTYTLTFVIVMLLVVAIVIGVAVSSPIASVINRNTHAITIGEHKLTTVDLAYHYIDAVDEYYNTVYQDYGESMGSMWQLFLGFNTDTALDKQYYDEDKGITWAQYFVDDAIKNATEYYALYDQAMAKGHKLTEDEQEALDLVEKNISTMATYYGYSDADQYLRVTYGNGANVETYANYCEITAYASSYAAAYSDSLEFTDEQIREYEKDKYLNYTSFSYSFYIISVNSYLPEGTKDESGKVTHTDADKASALAAAKADADALAASGATTAEKLTEAIKKLAINKDKKDAACTERKDVFYENLDYKEIQDWLADEDRKVDDLASIPIIIKDGEGEDAKEQVSGYLIVINHGRNDNLTKLVSVRHILSKFKGGYYDEDYNLHYTDTSKATAKETVEKLLKEWKNGKATEESFAELAKKNTDDSNGDEGGLYKDIYPGQMVATFNDWCFDESRKPGDTGIVETEYGYHAIYFVETQDLTFRDYLIKNDLNAEKCNEYLESISKAIKVEKVDLSGLKWDLTLA